jgi:hypothetical protein
MLSSNDQPRYRSAKCAYGFRIDFNWNPSHSYARILARLRSIPDYEEEGIPRDAFSIGSYSDSPLQDVNENWNFENTRIQTADGRVAMFKESRGVTGLPAE